MVYSVVVVVVVVVVVCTSSGECGGDYIQFCLSLIPSLLLLLLFLLSSFLLSSWFLHLIPSSSLSFLFNLIPSSILPPLVLQTLPSYFPTFRPLWKVSKLWTPQRLCHRDLQVLLCLYLSWLCSSSGSSANVVSLYRGSRCSRY